MRHPQLAIPPIDNSFLAIRDRYREAYGEHGRPPDSCEECHHSQALVDPYATGDRWYVTTECNADGCPWDKDLT